MHNFNEFKNKVWADQKTLNQFTNRAYHQLQQIFLELDHKPSQVFDFTGEGASSAAMSQLGCNVQIPEDSTVQPIDTVLCLDEFFTYNKDETSQYNSIEEAVKLLAPSGIMLASMRDYRNNAIHRRSIGDSTALQLNHLQYLIIEAHTPSKTDKQNWQQNNFVIENATVATSYALGDRRTLYFKQLAKYCYDLGCKQFGVLKDHFWISPWKKQVEHIAWGRF